MRVVWLVMHLDENGLAEPRGVYSDPDLAQRAVPGAIWKPCVYAGEAAFFADAWEIWRLEVDVAIDPTREFEEARAVA